MGPALLETQGVMKRFGGLNAVDRVDFALAPGELVAVIGPNGAGKTTFVNLLSGALIPDAGTVRFEGRDISRLPIDARARLGIARSFQIASIFPDLSAVENVALAAQAHAGHSFGFWRPVRAETALLAAAEAELAGIGLAEAAHRPAGQLSHGEKRLVEIAMALVTKPRVLLLDEPMAGLGVAEARRMVSFLASLKGRFTILLVEHDMDAVFALADRVFVLASGARVADAPPDAVRADPRVQLAYLGDDADAG
ncbi:ABC transporter ATP-binding protein [Xanthobacter oligotrophicus]|uniref:ABC transporter ATP-binding protein n=1 Tax=Xanthobacter oligotrophicus TaxID=2607286 RepID=UPI0011F18520|nr:ABC transporter ATP-binding protein [Xanthobacter oligotrophicus]MCG5237910.1 ABC transporter ATP-binding protein [Xanthobacter oligotrophicus]